MKRSVKLGVALRDKLQNKEVLAMEALEAHHWLNAVGVPFSSSEELMLLPLTERIRKYAEMQRRTNS